MRRSLPLVLAAAVLGVAPIAPAAAASRAPQLTGVRCVPPTAAVCRAGVQVRIGSQLQLRGTRLASGMRVSFRWSRGALATKLRRTTTGYTARVPSGVRAGTVSVSVRDHAGRRSNVKRVTILAQPTPTASPAPAVPTGALPQAFAGDGMWIWYLKDSEGGNLDAIAARATGAGMGTVFVKAADGTDAWPQFTPLLVAGLHARGLRACAWQFVYGDDPTGEAAVAASAIQAGADCFVVDAETRYEGRYAAAQTYMTALRAAVGPGYPIGLTSFPYVDYHPKLPYSVFLGPGGAQVNLPQVYWKDIGGTVDAVSAHTFSQNRIYPAPQAPLGQAYGGADPADLVRFRADWAAYGAAGVSWWDWQSATDAMWAALTAPAPGPAMLTDPGWPALASGSKGDEVIWLQEHLTSTYPTVRVTGAFDAATVAAVSALQTAKGLPANGATDAATWAQVLALPDTPVDWTAAG